MSSNGTWLFLLPPTTAAAADAFFTLNGQADYYWSSGAQIHEGNPIGYAFLSVSPVAFVSAITLWILAFNVVLLFLARWAAQWTSLGLMMAHLFGACTWIIQLNYGLVWVLVVCVVTRIAVHPVYFGKRPVRLAHLRTVGRHLTRCGR